MGRVGFSLGFGGAPPKEQQDQVSVIPGMSGMTVSTSQVAGAGVDIPALDGKGEEGAPPVVAALRRSETSDMQKLRERLSELEAEIKRLNAEQVDDDQSDQKIAALEELLEEKRESEQKLMMMIAEMQTRLDQQRKLIDDLMKRMDASPTQKAAS